MLRAIGRFFWRFMIIFSFIVNIILVIVLLVLGILLFEIKNQIAQPLVTGLHSSFVGLDNATIDWTIPVRDQIPVVLDIPLETDTTVILTENVPLSVTALIDLPGINAYNVQAAVNLELPAGLELPVALDLDVHVDQPLDVALDVRAVIPLQETQLHDVADNLRLLFEPLAVGLTNLPNDFGGAFSMVRDTLSGNPPNLLAENEYTNQPWPGYSTTAGLGYELMGEPVPAENIPTNTGIVPIGGIPALDEQLRPEVYAAGGPLEVNAQSSNTMAAMNVPPQYFNGQIGDSLALMPAPVDQQPPPQQTGTGDTTQTQSETGDTTDQGIIPTPTPSGG